MSKANSPIKVLRVALKRVTSRWGKNAWSKKDSGGIYRVCLEGAITGGCKTALTPAQQTAMEVIREVLNERNNGVSIPNFNDAAETTLEDIQETIKLAIIKLETGWPDDDYIDPDEVESLLN